MRIAYQLGKEPRKVIQHIFENHADLYDKDPDHRDRFIVPNMANALRGLGGVYAYKGRIYRAVGKFGAKIEITVDGGEEVVEQGNRQRQSSETNAPANVQIIRGDDGIPDYVVIPYAENMVTWFNSD